MSQALRDVIPIMGLLQEMREQDFKVLCTKPYVYCKVFEDNSGALELARLHKLCPRTKHINVCYHHFSRTCAEGAYQNIPHWHQGSDCWCSYQALGTKRFSTSSSPHVQQVTSTSYQSERVLRYEKLWYQFYRYLCVSPGTTQKCMLHNSVRYQNTHSRDPITLLSMDILVETFLEIGVSDLLVSTQCLQDPLYMEVWETTYP